MDILKKMKNLYRGTIMYLGSLSQPTIKIVPRSSLYETSQNSRLSQALDEIIDNAGDSQNNYFQKIDPKTGKLI